MSGKGSASQDLPVNITDPQTRYSIGSKMTAKSCRITGHDLIILKIQKILDTANDEF